MSIYHEKKEKRWKNPYSEWEFEKEIYKCATTIQVASCVCAPVDLARKPNFAINAQLAYMCNTIRYTHTHKHIMYSSDRFVASHKFTFAEFDRLIDRMIVLLFWCFSLRSSMCVWFCNYGSECTHAQWILIERPRDWHSPIELTKEWMNDHYGNVKRETHAERDWQVLFHWEWRKKSIRFF